MQTKTHLAFALVVTFVGTTTAQANIVWDWSNAGTGTEQGTFTTDGNLVAGLAPAATYTLSDFSLTASSLGLPLGSVSGGVYSISGPTVGFIWDGVSPTQFFRASGVRTNGFSIVLAVTPPIPQPANIVFNVDKFIVENDDEDTLFQETLTVDLTPVPEPTSLIVWSLLGCVALTVGGRRRKRSA